MKNKTKINSQASEILIRWKLRNAMKKYSVRDLDLYACIFNQEVSRMIKRKQKENKECKE